MSERFGLRSLRSQVWGLAAALSLALGSMPAQTPPSAPPIVQDTVFPNLFFGAIPPGIPQQGGDSPVLVFVHGLSGSYVDWIEANNCPSPAPGPPAPPCKSPEAGNDMYDYAYQAGFRTAIMSLSPDNSNNTTSIQTNGAMLQSLFPEILSYFGVSKVYFVAHSKGGLDLEQAISSSQWLPMASSVIELGTPNQGDALADWLFSSKGQAICTAIATLCTPAVQSLEIANVQSLRAEWDPIFQNARIQFYTLSGNTYACPPLDKGCSTSITGPILKQITGSKTAKPPANDGLVTRPETFLPNSYAEELGIIHADHFELRLGDFSFPYVYGRIIQHNNEQPGPNGLGAQVVATGGFGDIHNTWAWSMAFFNGLLYVGTGRETYCVTSATAAIELNIPALYPPAIGDCTADYHHLPLQAEIWQYNPATSIWTRVFQSDDSLMTLDKAGALIHTARDIGYRGLTPVTEPDGTQALYAGGVTGASIFEPTTMLGSWPPPRILRTTDGVHWAPLPQNGTLTQLATGSSWTPAPGAFLGSLTAEGTYCPTQPCEPPAENFPNYSLRSAAQLNGVLYVQTGDFPGVGRVFASAPGANPALGDNCGLPACFQWASPPTPTLPIWILESFNGYLYAGTGSPPGAGPAEYGVWKTDGTLNGTGTGPNGTCQDPSQSCSNWTYVVTDGGFLECPPGVTTCIADYAMSLQVFPDPTFCPAGCLYAGTDRPNELIRIHPDPSGLVPVACNAGIPQGITPGCTSTQGTDPSDSWDLVVGAPRTIPPGFPGAGEEIFPISGIGQYFDNGFTGHFWRMGVGSQGLYMGTWDFSSNNADQPSFSPLWDQEFGTDVWRTPDGVHWSSVTKIGFGDGNNTGSRSFASTPLGLYMGTARSIGGTQVFLVDNGTLDFNADGIVDQKDVSLLKARIGQAAKKPIDPMDLNQDGKIGNADVALLQKHCTNPGCAGKTKTQAAATTLATPLLGSQPGPLGGVVSLAWTPVTGAVDYLVFRIAMSPTESSPAPDVTTAQVAAACNAANAAAVCSQLPEAAATKTAPLFGYPGPPQLLTRATTTAYSETSPNALQSLYYVRAEDGNGNLSAPSNVVGGPSLSNCFIGQTGCP